MRIIRKPVKKTFNNIRKPIIRKAAKKNFGRDVNEIWEAIIENNIATEDECSLVTDINGYSERSLNDIIYARTGYHNMEQYLGENEDFACSSKKKFADDRDKFFMEVEDAKIPESALKNLLTPEEIDAIHKAPCHATGRLLEPFYKLNEWRGDINLDNNWRITKYYGLSEEDSHDPQTGRLIQDEIIIEGEPEFYKISAR